MMNDDAYDLQNRSSSSSIIVLSNNKQENNNRPVSCCLCCLKKNQNAPRPSEHPPVRGGGNVKTFRLDQRLCKYKTSS